MATEKREFGAHELTAALAYIEAMPPDIRRIQIEAWGHISGWQLVYGDERSKVAQSLGTVVGDRRFRVRGLTSIMNDDRAN